MNYSDLTLRHFETAAHAGQLSGPATRRGAAGSRALGTWVQFDVACERGAQGEILRAARFQAYGCPHVIAVADWVAAQAVGLVAVARLPESVPALQQRFAVPTEKLGRLLVVEDAWIAALSAPSSPA